MDLHWIELGEIHPPLSDGRTVWSRKSVEVRSDFQRVRISPLTYSWRQEPRTYLDIKNDYFQSMLNRHGLLDNVQEIS